MKDTGYSSPDKIRRSGAPRGAPTARSEIKEETRQVESPLIILKRKIEDRRRARGEEELKIDFTSPPVQHEMSPQEIEKRERRKEQNRRAAQKCREKKRRLQSTVHEDFQRVYEENQKLEGEVSNLKKEKDHLERTLREHMQSGTCKNLKNESHEPAPLPPGTLAPILTKEVLTSTPVFVSTYLSDMGSLKPEDTFVDLNMAIRDLNGTEMTNCDSISYFVATTPEKIPKTMSDIVNGIPMPPLHFLDQTVFELTSPMASHDSRSHSVSSTASDWSATSDQSRGFVPDGYNSTDTEGYVPLSPTSASCYSRAELADRKLSSDSFLAVCPQDERQDWIARHKLSDAEYSAEDDVFDVTDQLTGNEYFQTYKKASRFQS